MARLGANGEDEDETADELFAAADLNGDGTIGKLRYRSIYLRVHQIIRNLLRS
jgi:hypothetical protein